MKNLNWRALLIELIGTFFLVFTVALSGNPLAVGGIIAAMIYMGGYISGGHFNPAVTLAVLLRGNRISVKDALLYMFAQVVGGVLAASVFYLMAGSAFYPEAGTGLSTGLIVTSEILFTLALGLTVLHVATSDKIKDNNYYGLAIGLVIMAGGFAVGPISSAVFNPAVGLGTLLVALGDLGNNASTIMTFIGSFILAPFAGGALAALLYRLTAPVTK